MIDRCNGFMTSFLLRHARIAVVRVVAVKALIREKSAQNNSRQRCGNLPGTSLSDARVPCIASLWSRGAQPLAETFQTVGDRQVGDVFHALVAELAGEP